MKFAVQTLHLLMLSALLGACAKPSGPPAPKARPAPLVVVTPVTVRDVAVESHAPVELRPLEQAEVVSKTLGYLDAVFVDRGDRVRKGQLLALVRPSDLPDQLSAARGSLAQSQSSLALARANRDRAKALAPTGVISQQELQQAEAAVATAEATEASAQAQIGALGVRIGETRIESPLDGYVSVRRLDPGALVGPQVSSALLTIVRTERLRVFITVNEHDAVRVAIGNDAHIELDGIPGQSFTGRVVRLAPVLDPGTRTLEAEVQLDNPDGKLRPGMYGYGSIVLDVHKNAVAVPASAVQISSTEANVFVLNGDSVSRRKVIIGVDGGAWLEITSGLSPKDEVVTAGADTLSDGTKVRVTRGVDPFNGAQLPKK